MTVLERIRATLEGLLADEQVPMKAVGYGGTTVKEYECWNYFVFNRIKRTKNNKSRMDRQTFYEVHIVHEDFIPEGYIDRVIEALEAESDPGTKLRQTDDDVVFNYTRKGKTDLVVEIATVTFYHPEKRC